MMLQKGGRATGFFGAVVLGLLATGVARAQTPGQYTLFDLGSIGSTSVGTQPVAGLNNLGQIVGNQSLPYSYVSGGNTINTTYQNAYFSGANGGTIRGLGAATGTPNATTGLPPSSQAYGINDNGLIAGRTMATGTVNDPTFGSLVYTNIYHAFRLNSNTENAISSANDLGTLGQAAYRNSLGGTSTNSSFGYAINASGQITGASTANVNGATAANNYNHAFRINANETTLTAANDLGTLGTAGSTFGQAINSIGQVAGYGTNGSGSVNHAFRLSVGANKINSATDDLGTLAGNATATSFGYGINDSGQVVGQSGTASGQTHAFRSSANGSTTTLTDLGVLTGNLSSSAFGINTAGQVVGYSQSSAGINRAFIYTSQMYDLNSYIVPSSNPNNVVLNVAYGINDNGGIAAYGVDGGVVHAFLLKPFVQGAATPDAPPATLVLTGLALGAALWRRRTPRATA